MKPKLIILRGNSGSGKSTIARELQKRMGYGTALIEQDYIRRTMLRERERPHLPNIGLIALNVRYALEHHYNVILEGILREERYGDMLRKLLADHKSATYVYYFDVSLEETFKRHATKPNSHEFGHAELQDWFKHDDFLGVENEQTISESSSFDETLERILSDVTFKID